MSIKYSECVFVSLVIQHAKQMCLVTLLSVAGPALSYFGKGLLNVKCVFWFSLHVDWNISHAKKNSTK